MKKDDNVYLCDILDAISDVEQIVKDLDEQNFYKNISAKHAVVRCIEIIGEASKHISKDFRQKYDNIPWSDICKMRDKAIHDYSGVDYAVIWKVVQIDIPELKEKLESILKEIESRGR